MVCFLKRKALSYTAKKNKLQEKVCYWKILKMEKRIIDSA